MPTSCGLKNDGPGLPMLILLPTARNEFTIDGAPAAYLQEKAGVFDNAILESALDTAVDVSVPVDATPTPDTVSIRDVITAMQSYELLKQGNLVEGTYEDFLRSYGVRLSKPELENVPELLRYTRTWTYPSAHVQPSTVTAGDDNVTSACSWSIAERADKDRFFREPGFIVGFNVVRPKTYRGNQKRPAVSLLDDQKSWLPAVLSGTPEASWKQVTDAATDILGGTGSANWWVDLKDLFLYGDQFMTHQADVNEMASPTAALGVKGPVQADVDALYVSGDATAGVKQDGVARIVINTHLVETSPRGTIVAAL